MTRGRNFGETSSPGVHVWKKLWGYLIQIFSHHSEMVMWVLCGHLQWQAKELRPMKEVQSFWAIWNSFSETRISETWISGEIYQIKKIRLSRATTERNCLIFLLVLTLQYYFIEKKNILGWIFVFCFFFFFNS